MATLTGSQSTHSLPRSLFASVPWVWSRVLFPGSQTGSKQIRTSALALVIILPAALLYPCVSFRLLEPDEGRYAEIPREMLQRGEWVVPYLNAQPYLDKPPLLYWLVMGSYKVFGVHDWSARIPSALAIHATILMLYLIGRRSIGERAAFWGAMFLSVAPGFMTMGRLLILDGLLTACTTMALLAAYEAVRGERLRWNWWIASAAAVGFGMLTKGPVALILLAPPIWIHRRLHGAGCPIGWRAIAAFLGVAATINLPWYAAMGIREPVFLKYFLWEHNVVRFVAPFDHIRPVWFYLPVLAAGLLPGSLLLPGFVQFLLTSNSEKIRQRSPEMSFFLIAGGWCVLFFSAAGSKLPTYVLPAMPMLLMALGAHVALGKRMRHTIAAALVITGAALLGWLHYVGIPWYAQIRSPMGEPEKVARCCADPNETIICFPRSCDSVAFYLQRDDLRISRSKEALELIKMLQDRPRTILLFTHRHSLEALRDSLPGDLAIVEVVTFKRDKAVAQWFDALTTETPWGLCDLAVIERRK
jgi:4-amino-4-deoxy-L-arabinose transferase-like glycosyltransferase